MVLSLLTRVLIAPAFLTAATLFVCISLLGYDAAVGWTLATTTLEMTGLAVAGSALARNRVEVGGGRPIREIVVKRMKRLFRRRVSETVHLSASVGGSVGIEGSVENVVRPGPNSSIERRVEILEQRADLQDRRFRDLRKHFRDDLQQARDEARQRFGSAERHVQGLEARLGHLVNHGASLEAMGLWWVSLGVVGQSLARLLWA